MIQKDVKQQIIAENKINEKDTGSPEVQIAILTNRINSLTEHLKVNPKDPLVIRCHDRIVTRDIAGGYPAFDNKEYDVLYGVSDEHPREILVLRCRLIVYGFAKLPK